MILQVAVRISRLSLEVAQRAELLALALGAVQLLADGSDALGLVWLLVGDDGGVTHLGLGPQLQVVQVVCAGRQGAGELSCLSEGLGRHGGGGQLVQLLQQEEILLVLGVKAIVVLVLCVEARVVLVLCVEARVVLVLEVDWVLVGAGAGGRGGGGRGPQRREAQHLARRVQHYGGGG